MGEEKGTGRFCSFQVFDVPEEGDGDPLDPKESPWRQVVRSPSLSRLIFFCLPTLLAFSLVSTVLFPLLLFSVFHNTPPRWSQPCTTALGPRSEPSPEYACRGVLTERDTRLPLKQILSSY